MSPTIRPQVLGARGVDELPFDPLRQTGVRQDHRARRAHRAERVEAALRPGPAVDPDGVDVEPSQRRGGRSRQHPVGERDLLAERQERDDRPVGGGPLRLLDGDREVLDRGERLEHEQVDAALEQPVDHLPERGADAGRVEVDQVVGRRPERSHGPGDQHVPAGDVAGLAGDLGAAPRQPAGLVGEAIGGQTHPVGAKGRGLDQVSAGRQVLAMDRTDELRPRQDELVEGGPLRDPAREEQRAHRPVRQQRAGGEAFPEPSARFHARTIPDASRANVGAGRPDGRPCPAFA